MSGLNLISALTFDSLDIFLQELSSMGLWDLHFIDGLRMSGFLYLLFYLFFIFFFYLTSGH